VRARVYCVVLSLYDDTRDIYTKVIGIKIQLREIYTHTPPCERKDGHTREHRR
jgi:hypothetical protein